MGDLISLAEHRRSRRDVPAAERDAGAVPRAARTPRVTFAFDLSSPFTYLAVERVERLFGGVVWKPVLEEAMQLPPADVELAATRADALGLPLVWPEGGIASARPAMRVASLAAEHGCAAPFVLAASRLAFCGGFELDHPEVLAEAAAAANLGLEDALRAAGDVGRDGALEAAGRKLLAQGADALPVLRVGRLLFAGEHRLGEAVMAAQAPAARAV